MDVRRRYSSLRIGCPHRRAQLRQGIAARDRADQQPVRTHGGSQRPEDDGQLIDRIECADGEHEVVTTNFGPPVVFNDGFSACRSREQRPGIEDVDALCFHSSRPRRVRAAEKKRRVEPALDQFDSLEAIFERTLEQEELGAGPRGPIAAHGPEVQVEQVGHGMPLVRCAPAGDKSGRMVLAGLRTAARWALDFALPARCAGCGTIVAEVHSFCPDCWRRMEFLGDSGCSACGLPLQATEATSCAVCLAKPPRIARTRAAVAYDELSRGLAIRLKYGRKVAIARTMARYMAPLVASAEDHVLVPVPLHRTRLWRRGFNQSALVARELSRRLNIASDPFVLRRVKRTPPLKGMSPLHRRKIVAGAFKVTDKAALAGKTVILVDDVLTTGSTAESCARTLRRAGAARVELVSWARVVRPAQLMR